ncbi:MAG: ABC transporter ATP-binding protein [Candidatus Bathyarchaeia archaeon]
MFPIRQARRRQTLNLNNGDILRVEHLQKYFPVEKSFLEKLLAKNKHYVKAVDDVSFAVRRGEIFTLAGESGCGKTTTGKLALKLASPTGGSIFFDDIDITRLKGESLRNLRRKMQMIFQDPYASFNPRMKIGDAIGHPLTIHGVAQGTDRQKRVMEILERVGLSPAEKFTDLFPHQMSGGQRQRAAMARSLVLQPEFIVADEPVSMIDVSLRTAIIDLMLDLRKDLGLTYLFITHDLAVAKYISDRIAIMYLGKIVELGDKDAIFFNPAHPYTKALLAAIPVPNPERKRRATELIGEVPSAVNIPSGCRFRTRCRYAEQACSEKEPDLVEISPGHFAACSLVEE